MGALPFGQSLDRSTRLRVVDTLAIVLAVSLPWSTSATAVLVALWLVAVVFTLVREDRDILFTAAGGLPMLLVLLGVAGMAWADVSLVERWGGLGSFLKLLLIPLMLAHFRRSDRGMDVFCGYLLSCIVLLLTSYAIVALHLETTLDFGVPVKNAATQSGEFATCILGLLYLSDGWMRQRRWLLVVLAATFAFAMLANLVFIATGRTALVVILVLLVVFAAMHLTRRGIVVLCGAAVIVGAAAWFSSPYLRERTEQIWSDARAYEALDVRNSSGERIEFAKRSLEFIRTAPIIGHGTGTIHSQFLKAAAGKTGAAGVAAANPHNQTFAVGIQLGLVGIAVLWAMWIAHLLLFRGAGLAAWIGLVVVVQNIVGSLFNSHLFDFLQGWTYVVGVGVAGGMMLRARTMRGDAV